MPFTAKMEDKIRALYWFASDYHSGQWSRGYRLLCVADRALERNGHNWDRFQSPLGKTGSAYYEHLVKHYREVV